MIRLLIATFCLMLLSGCTTRVSSDVREQVWYSEGERPASAPWHVYLVFTDDVFHLLRTVEKPDDVSKKIDSYMKGAGLDVGSPVPYTRTENDINAVSRTPFLSRTGDTVYTDVRTFRGRFVGDALEIDFERITVWPPRPTFSEGVRRWSLKRLSSLQNK
ncbi:hypothetical protein G3435_25930 [Pseudomonas sp. MAFF212428]|uniref:Lipoprotein n=1 Tax=Pseudomonas brassicae TaxID=2708063 RepID=A0A6M0CY69_9PSED|nr:hypothetical protein [Pseudomonas brassicae]